MNDDLIVEVIVVDYSDQLQAAALVSLLNTYACDPMGGGEPLSDYVQDNVVAQLAQIPHAFSILCYVNGEAAGLVNCFDGFSTFTCKPLVNIHDIVVHPKYRGYGVSQRLLSKVEHIARSKGCGKMTLEVLQGNTVAQSAYRKFGFAGYELAPEVGQAVFWQKYL